MADRLSRVSPTRNLWDPTVNHSHCTRMDSWFHTCPNTYAAATRLREIDATAIDPLRARLPRAAERRKASRGSATAVRAARTGYVNTVDNISPSNGLYLRDSLIYKIYTR